MLGWRDGEMRWTGGREICAECTAEEEERRVFGYVASARSGEMEWAEGVVLVGILSRGGVRFENKDHASDVASLKSKCVLVVVACFGN